MQSEVDGVGFRIRVDGAGLRVDGVGFRIRVTMKGSGWGGGLCSSRVGPHHVRELGLGPPGRRHRRKPRPDFTPCKQDIFRCRDKVFGDFRGRDKRFGVAVTAASPAMILDPANKVSIHTC